MSPQSNDPATILIIDHDLFMGTAIAAALHYGGHECHTARTAEAAGKAARSLTLDLIICDTKCGNDGFSLCRELRQEPGMEDVPVIFLSDSTAANEVQRAHESGGAYYLRKPFDPDVLIDLVDKALWMPHLIGNRIARVHSHETITSGTNLFSRAARAMHEPRDK